ncbi:MULTISPECIES: aminotransferase class V-fold PLP-dependent enzyme [Tenacibaculum]|uniref:aminotransferase class V-fold PLP-dependent enzyme n=1 Tax=Tenacibaculum TaxID=104267 RepID=UPI001F0B0FCD|nr:MULTISPECIES: aminotransferase class V-fold PLP-dependent enzyme [Tenacibaculum]MCH3881988.1 aminotransferase class V-fold PLP-dependent enzyme [Tenacibaculum aquimarinum]MDO6600741.1 aminotransferase class V-fold PLP-dependent enzyme [Tenacibaculum sp. 1_MG-2023]
MILENQKHLFSFPEEITYLNIASQSPSFKTVEQAGIEALLEKSNPHKITGDHYFEPVKEVKQLFAKLIDVEDYNRIANIPSASYGLATAANNITLKKGDEILLIEEQFPSNYYVWEKLANKFDATIKIASMPISKENRGENWNEVILNSISDKTAVVTLGNIHWANGTLFDLKSIRQKATENNALLIIDGSQSVGALPFSVKEIQPDALICAGYKWLFGPYGCGYAYFGSYFDGGNPLEENWSNRLHSENLSGLTSYQPKHKPLANRYSAGEHASFIYIKMQIAALKQVLDWTPNAIQNYCKEITSEVVVILKENGCYIEDSDFRSHHLFGVQLPKKLDVEKLKSKLKKANIFISFRGNYIRISCHLYNTKEDFKKLTDCILSCL